jgi:hypothetical protein
LRHERNVDALLEQIRVLIFVDQNRSDRIGEVREPLRSEPLEELPF